MEMSSAERLDFYSVQFNNIVNGPLKRAEKASALEGLADNMRAFGQAIDHVQDLQISFIKTVTHCQTQIAGQEDFTKARSILATILTPKVGV